MRSRSLEKALSVVVCAVLVLMAPGPACYQALASEIKAPEGEALQPPRPIGGTAAPLNALNAPIDADLGISAPSVPSGVSVAQPQSAASAAQPTVAAVNSAANAAARPLILPAPLTDLESVQAAAPVASMQTAPEKTAEPAAAAGGALQAGQPGLGLVDRQSAQTLADPKAEKSGVLSWIFDRLKGKAPPDAAAAGAASAAGRAPSLAPATSSAKPAPIVPSAPEAGKTASAPQRPGAQRVLGVAIGTALAFGALAFSPHLALMLPAVGWGIGGLIPAAQPGAKREENGSSAGAVLGTLAAAALVATGLSPLSYVLILPLAGSIIGYGIASSLKTAQASHQPRPTAKAAAAAPVQFVPAAQNLIEGKARPEPGAAPVAKPAATPEPAAKPEEKPAPAAAEGKTPKTPRSYKNLPADARESSLAALLAAKADAQERARALAKSAQLVAVAINLDQPNAHWSFVFQSKSRKITVYQRSVKVERLKESEKAKPVLWNSRFKNAGDLEAAYTALKADKHWFKPVRVELRPTWKGDPYWLFTDAKRREVKIEAKKEAPAPAPTPAPPADRAPPAQTKPAPAPPAEKTPQPAPAPPQDKPADAKPQPPAPPKFNPISEGFFGYRWVKGIQRSRPDGSKVGSLAVGASVAQIIDHISAQFDIPREKVVALGKELGFTEASPAKDWFGIYDRLQAANKAKRDQYDHEKHGTSVVGELFAHGLSYLPMPAKWKESLRKTEGSFRRLSNRTYAPGWKGALVRLTEVHKHFVGAFVRFPYELFDMFVFGFFRRNMSFEWRHAGEDYLNIETPGAALKHLEAAMRQQAFRGDGVFGAALGTPAGRVLNRYVVSPFVSPLLSFLKRRGTMAVMSAMSMGVLGAVAPGIAIMSVSLTSIPLLGSALMWAAHGLPAAMVGVPVVGSLLAPVIGAAFTALLKDLIVGRLLNTLILATSMTITSVLPNAIAQERFAAQEKDPKVRLSTTQAAARALSSGKFWWTLAKQDWKSFVGMVTVGAEIEGIMTYAHGVDAMVSSGIGHDFKVFEKIGASIERPAEWRDDHGVIQHNAIPFGGAITWGSTLLYKAETALHFNISDKVMFALNPSLKHVGPNGVPASAQQLVQMATHRPDQNDKAVKDKDGNVVKDSPYEFDKELYKKSPAEVKARVEKLMAQAGQLEQELKAAKQWQVELKARLSADRARAADLQDKIKKTQLSPEEQAEYDRLIKELAAKRDEGYAKSKLAEVHDINAKDPAAENLAKLKQLEALRKYYETALVPPSDSRAGYLDQVNVNSASLGALKAHLQAIAENKAYDRHEGAGSSVDPDVLKRLVEKVDAIEKIRQEAQGEMANRDAIRQLLAVENKARNHALDDRRSGKEMLELHKNMSRLATVMDMALALNEINAAETAIKQMEKLLDQRLANIQASQQQNQQNLSNANNNAGQISQWKQQAQGTINSDQQQQQKMVTNEQEASQAVTRITAYQTNTSQLIAQINAQDKGQSVDALTEYNRRLALLPQAQQWLQTGNPNDPSAFSMKTFTDNLALIQSNITAAQSGLAKIPGVPKEFGALLILAVPGPSVSLTNPSQAQILQVLSDRKTYWQNQAAPIQKDLDSINRMLDPGNTNTTTDVFGSVHPESLPVWRAQQQAQESQSQGQAQQLLSQIDALASDINAKLGAGLPPLSGLPLAQLQTAIQSYGDKVKAINIPNTDTPDIHAATLEVLEIAQLLPKAAHGVILWSEADGTVKAINDAMTNTLPQAQAGIAGLVQMFKDVQADIDKDVAFVNGSGETGEAVAARKTDLLQNKVLVPLQAGQAMIQTVLIPYQQQSIAGMASNSNGQYYQLFTAQSTLMTQLQNLYNQTVPWSLATKGGAYGNAADSHAHIAAWRASLQQNLNGYTDSSGNKVEGLLQYQQDVANRIDPNYSGTETLYGEQQPYALVGPHGKIAVYTAERASRATLINGVDAQINDILNQIQTLSKGQYNLQSYLLPVGVTADAAGVAKVNAAVNGNVIQNLTNQLKTIGDAATKAAGDLSIGGNSGPTTPVGNQPPITINDYQKMALLCLDAAKRLAPSSLQIYNPNDTTAAYDIARFLYADGVVSGATDALNNQIPVAQKFIADGVKAVGDAVADTNTDDAYVNANGTGETADHVFARKIAIYSELDAFLKEGISFFGIKTGWDQGAFSTINQINTYYSSLQQIYQGGQTVNASEITAYQKMLAGLQNTFSGLEANRAKVTSWLSQLNDPHDSALRRVNESMSDLQTKTRAVLEENIKWHDLQDQLTRSENVLKADLTKAEAEQDVLKDILAKNDLQDKLPPNLVARLDRLRLGQGMWQMGSGTSSDPSALIIKKSEFGRFVESVLGLFQAHAQDSGQDMSAIRSEIMSNPQSLAGLIPDSRVVDFGDTADGFYMVYQSHFGTPNGLELGSWVTLGNVAKVWGNNVSVTGYQFSSPPENAAVDGASNAPYGDKGVEVQIESLQGKNWVNYLNVDFHRFAFDIPPDISPSGQANQDRVMIFDDFAVMLFGDRLYVGLAGLADFAPTGTKDKPSYYGGNFKTSLKLTEVMSLNAEQQAMFARDPRTFLQTVNLDFTGYDPDLNQQFNIAAKGDNKEYYRTQVGPSFNIARLLAGANSRETPDSFTMDLFWSKTSGTDDINQQALGASILKGFTLKDDSGKPWMVIQNKTTGELGQQYNTLTDRLSVTLPNYGIVVSGQGQILGNAQAYYGEIAKKMGDNSTISLGYGAPYVGMNNRLSLNMNTSFTLGQLWQAVVDNSKENLKGGETLKQYNKDLTDFFTPKPGEKPSKNMDELRRVFEQDVARKLIEQDIGTLTRDIEDLRKAGALMDNTRVRAMVGFVSNGVGTEIADRATGGGFTAGTVTELTLNKTQKALIEAKAQNLYRDGLELQDRMLELTQEWQASVAQIAQAQWDLKMAGFIVQNSPDPAIRREAEVKQAEATERLHQAVVHYNILSGRNPTDATPFDNLNSADLEALMGEIRKTISTPDRLKTILGSLSPDELKKRLGEDKYDIFSEKDEDLKARYHSNPFNLMDWLPLVDKLTVGIGLQLQDAMANQQFGAGMSLRMPFYDPSSKAADHSYVLETKGTIEQMLQAYEDRHLKTDAERAQADLWKINSDAARPALPGAIQNLSDAIRAYRNGLISPAQLRQSFESWHWYVTSILDADNKSAVSDAVASTYDDPAFVRKAPMEPGPSRITSLDAAVDAAVGHSHSLKEVGLREQAAEEMTRSNDHRIQKAFLTLNVGMGLTATGVNWVPSLSITGIPVTPMLGFEFKPEELKELQVQEGKGQTAYYHALKDKLETGLAVAFYQNIVAGHAADESEKVISGQVLPALTAELARQRASGSQSDVVAAQKNVDAARMQLEQARLAKSQAAQTINYLLGREPNAAIEVDLSPEQALTALRQRLAAKSPVAAEKAILDSRVQVARAVETIADKDLKKEQLATEPISIIVRSLGRLLTALGGDSIGNADLVAAARVQTLTEQRARDEYDSQREVQIARLRAERATVESELGRLGDGADDQLKGIALKERDDAIKGALLALQAPDQASADQKYPDAPKSFAELRDRLEQKQRELSNRPPQDPVELMEPEKLIHQAEGFARYYYAKETLGRVPIDKSFLEGWIEVRLRSPDTPPEVLLKLAELRSAKADRLYRTQLEGASAQADILVADFQTNVRMLRWAEAARPKGLAAASDERAKFREQITARLDAEKDEIAAILGLDPRTSLEQLKALVPEEASGTHDILAMSDEFIKEIKDSQLERVRQTLFEGGLPRSFGAEDDIMNQVRANTIAERMSFKGFTPIAAWGMFRGEQVSGVFLEAPDPRAIQRGLENVLSDVLRKDLQSTGRLQELSLKMNQLMSKVEDGSHALERKRDLIQAAETDLRVKSQQGDDAEITAAKNRLVAAWQDFSSQMIQTKSDFISLVTELEALQQGRSTPLRPLASGPDRDPSALHRDRKAELLGYWADRMTDESFESGLSAVLDKLAAGVPADRPQEAKSLLDLKDRIQKRAYIYRSAKIAAELVMSKDFTPAEKLDLLTRNDKQGKREALQAEISSLLSTFDMANSQDPRWKQMLDFLQADVDLQKEKAGTDLTGADAASRALRDAFWHAVPAPYGVEGAFQDLEKAKNELQADRQALMESYLTDMDESPNRFVLKNLLLDQYLKAEQAFDERVIKDFSRPEVKGDPKLYAGLDALYDLRGAIGREEDAARHGRGLRAIDALIMLEKARLSAARYAGRSPTEIDAIVDALASLTQKKAQWAPEHGPGSTDLVPVYALAEISENGQHVWTVGGWLTESELAGIREADKARAANGQKPLLHEVGSGADRKLLLDELDEKTGAVKATREVVGGVDTLEAAKERARKSAQDNAASLDVIARMKNNDFALDRPTTDGREGYSADDVFGSKGLASQGRLFFFKAPKDGESANALHGALHPLEALRMSPDQYVMLVYKGDRPLARDMFPTWESVKGSDQADKFYRLSISEQGARAMIEKAREHQSAELREGWVDVKLNGYAFGRVDRADLDFENAKVKIRDEYVRDLDSKGVSSSDPAFLTLLEKKMAEDKRLPELAKTRDANRGKSYQVVDLFQTKDDLKSVRKAFQNADKDLQKARRDLGEAQQKEAEAKKTMDDKKEAARVAGLAYQKKQTEVRAAETLQLQRELVKFFQQGGDSPIRSLSNAELRKAGKISPSAAAFKLELDTRVAENKEYKQAQKDYDPFTSAYTKAAENFKDAHATTENAAKSEKDAETVQEHARTWSLFESDDLALSVDAQGDVLQATGHPVYGSQRLDERLGAGQSARVISGELMAAVLDDQGRVMNWYVNESDLDHAVPNWQIKSVAMRGESDSVTDAAGNVKPVFRLSHYEQDGLPVQLSRRYLIDRVKSADHKLTMTKYWGVMPWNWGSLLLEIPRGVVGAPLELLTGRDPRQEHYLGRVYMYKTEGGDTEHHGFFRQVVGFFDVLDLLPDHVERYYDPSQFPDFVQVDSPLKPGQSMMNKGMRYTNAKGDEKDVHYGAQSVQRAAVQSAEDLTTSKSRTLAHFSGGVEQIVIANYRGRAVGADGRAKLYQESRLSGTVGDPLDSPALRDENADAALVQAGANGEGEVTRTAKPGNLAVDKVEKRVIVRPGADQYVRQADALRNYGDQLSEQEKAARGAQDRLNKDLVKAGADVDGALADRSALDAATRKVWDRAYDLAWRIGEANAMKADLDRINGNIRSLLVQLGFWNDYQKMLEDAIAHRPTNPTNPTDPTQPLPNPTLPGSIGAWILALLTVAALLSAVIWGIIRRRRA